MDSIKKDTERIMRMALETLKELHAVESSHEKVLTKDAGDKMYMLLSQIMHLSKQILANEKEAMQRIGLDMKELFGGNEKGALEKLSIDLRKLFDG